MSIIYKACKNSIVTLELLPDSLTNEDRTGVVNSDFAKFRTNKAKVISIVNPETKEQLDRDYSMYDPTFVYTVGEVIICEFDSNINKVCSSGIHYFKTYEASLSWYYNYRKPYTDRKYIGYHDSGQKSYEHSYKDGVREGKQEAWYENGQKQYEDYYKEGWYENRQK